MNEPFPESEPEFDAGDNKEYKVKVIINSTIYVKEAQGYLPDLYYLVFWKCYLEEASTWEPSSTVLHLWKMISTFYKDHPEKPTTTSLSLNSTPPMAKPSVKLTKFSAKQKQGRPTCSTKQAKK